MGSTCKKTNFKITLTFTTNKLLTQFEHDQLYGGQLSDALLNNDTERDTEERAEWFRCILET